MNKEKDKKPSIHEMIEAQINLIRNSVMGENVNDLVKTAEKIFANLPANEIKDDDPIYFTVNPDVGLLIKKDKKLYYLWHDFVIRVVENYTGTTTDAFRKGKIFACDVTPPPN